MICLGSKEAHCYRRTGNASAPQGRCTIPFGPLAYDVELDQVNVYSRPRPAYERVKIGVAAADLTVPRAKPAGKHVFAAIRGRQGECAFDD